LDHEKGSCRSWGTSDKNKAPGIRKSTLFSSALNFVKENYDINFNVDVDNKISTKARCYYISFLASLEYESKEVKENIINNLLNNGYQIRHLCGCGGQRIEGKENELVVIGGCCIKEHLKAGPTTENDLDKAYHLLLSKIEFQEERMLFVNLFSNKLDCF